MRGLREFLIIFLSICRRKTREGISIEKLQRKHKIEREKILSLSFLSASYLSSYIFNYLNIASRIWEKSTEDPPPSFLPILKRIKRILAIKEHFQTLKKIWRYERGENENICIRFEVESRLFQTTIGWSSNKERVYGW